MFAAAQPARHLLSNVRAESSSSSSRPLFFHRGVPSSLLSVLECSASVFRCRSCRLPSILLAVVAEENEKRRGSWTEGPAARTRECLPILTHLAAAPSKSPFFIPFLSLNYPRVCAPASRQL